MIGRSRHLGERSPVTGRLKQQWTPQREASRRPSQLELLLFSGVIEKQHIRAAREWARIAGLHDRVISAPSRSAKSPDYQSARSGQDNGDGFRCKGCNGACEVACDAAEKIKRQWDDAKRILGSIAWGPVYDTVLLDEACSAEEGLMIARGLGRLAKSWLYGD
jgi:hypothetical protein